MSSNLKVNTILPSAGTAIGIGTAGGSMTITNGKVGINTDNPQQALHILRGQDDHLLYLQGGDTICDIVQSDNGGSTRLRSGNGYFYIWTGGDGNSSTGENGSPAFRLDPNLEAKFYNSILVPDKIEHDQDSDTSIRFPAYDTVSVETGGSERLRITSSGQFLMGATSTSDANIKMLIQGSGTTILRVNNTDDGTATLALGNTGSSNGAITQSGGHMTFSIANTERLRINSSGHTLPGSNNTYDLGSSSLRWRDIYTNDLHLSNQGSTNSVDNTWGDYTIQEGESDLYLINNRSGKKYKFNLTEVS